MWLDPEYTPEEARKDIKMLSLWHTSLFLSFWHLYVVSLGIFKWRPFFGKEFSPDLHKNQQFIINSCQVCVSIELDHLPAVHLWKGIMIQLLLLFV